ncbi:hypothetical protein Rhopal_000165-T1 [Rhodotorula paludigena]|uniref:Uncharacterized protein n=1 Tax=Rhodotorula paludigena TaxID=86838 RepID=A0AAV5GBS8_9BASI|nr:hypothetical protein Rhopal_000165-T1 [Rhodotorula paludigena]
MAPAHDASPSYCIPVASAAASASSHSHRLGASSAASSALASSRPRTRRAGSARGAVHAYSHDAATWLTARVGRTGLRRWMLVTLVSFGAAFLWSSSGSSPDAGAPQANSWWSALAGAHARGGPDPDAVPVVDRTALEKLRLLEIHFGADEDDPALDAHDDLEPAARYPAQRKRPHDLDRPPLVVDIPEWVKPNPSAPPPPDKVPADVLDAEVCGAQEGQRCQFLIPAWLGEQETKAQQHLYQLGLLALALNRTLVLPNVSRSRLGTCYKNPFAFYYSEDSLSDLGIPTISQDDFVAWTLQRDPPPSAQVVTMANAKATYAAGAIEIDSASDPTAVPTKPNRNLCLRAPRTRLDFSGHSPLAMFPPEGYHRSESGRLGFGESVINTLRSREVGSKSSRASSLRDAAFVLPDVLAFNYELRFPILSPAVAASFAPSLDIDPPDAFAHFPYADTWTQLADVLAARLSPFVAIHWRTETLTPDNLAPCASSLLHKLAALKRQYPSLGAVYLATDYPIESLDPSFSPAGAAGEVAHSGTFAKVVTEQHHAAMRRFLRDFAKTFSQGQLRLTTFSKEQALLADALAAGDETALPPDLLERLTNLTAPLSPTTAAGADTGLSATSSDSSPLLSLGALDSGLYGILDKLVATRAEVFLTGVPGAGSSTKGACAKLSSFTTQLVGAREERRRAQRVEDGLADDEGAAGGGGAGWADEEGERGRLWNTVTHFSLNGDD